MKRNKICVFVSVFPLKFPQFERHFKGVQTDLEKVFNFSFLGFVPCLL